MMIRIYMNPDLQHRALIADYVARLRRRLRILLPSFARPRGPVAKLDVVYDRLLCLRVVF